jgi:hypothetical protein
MVTQAQKIAFIDETFALTRAVRQGGAPIDASMAAAQVAHETGFGTSPLAMNHNNLFGITKGSSWTGPTHTNPSGEVFRSYAGRAACIRDYADLIAGASRYVRACAACDDPERFILALAQAGSAADPDYAAKVTAIWRTDVAPRVGAPPPLVPVHGLKVNVFMTTLRDAPNGAPVAGVPPLVQGSLLDPDDTVVSRDGWRRVVVALGAVPPRGWLPEAHLAVA